MLKKIRCPESVYFCFAFLYSDIIVVCTVFNFNEVTFLFNN